MSFLGLPFCKISDTWVLLWFLFAGVVAVSMTEALEGFETDFIELLAPMELWERPLDMDIWAVGN